jgi:Cu(I)/Ag(I) efflux system membrane protein CusA/SilA
MLGDVARVQLGPEMRRGIAELNGEGEVVGGVVVLRSGKNALAAIRTVHLRLDELKSSLPAGVEIITTYDRSQLIERAVANLRDKLLEEFIVVAWCAWCFCTCALGAGVMISLPLGVLASFIVMRIRG